MIKLVSALLLVVGLIGATASAGRNKQCVYTKEQLPQHIVPRHYELELDINTKEYKYDGKVRIELELAKYDDDQPSLNRVIVLKAHPDVEIVSVNYNSLGAVWGTSDSHISGYNSVIDVCRNKEKELLVIQLKESLPYLAKGELMVLFNAKIRDDNTGFYMSQQHDNTGSYYVSTDFKPDKARRAFPCFDEPSFKATFDISLTHDSSKVALSNAPLLHSLATSEGRQLSKFARTPLMSSYLVAFAIGKFEQIEAMDSRGRFKIRALTPIGKSKQAQFALITAINAIKLMEDYFDIPFPLDKLDLLSGPRQVKGARENWGLIIFEESVFLLDYKGPSIFDMNYIAETVVHHLAHQWFGNLVTMNNWNDLWLHAGFAFWMGNFLTNQLYPEMQQELNYIIETHQIALDKDSQLATHPIQYNKGINHQVFDEIIYLKSHAIIKHLHDEYIEPENFKQGIRRYLKHYAYLNVDASVLWNELQIVSRLPVEEFVKSWTKQAGHPLVSAWFSSNDDDGTKRLILEQRREFSSSSITQHNPSPQKWIIPMTILLSDGEGEQKLLKIIFNEHRTEIDLPNWFDPRRDDKHWLKVNNNWRGFYRVQYDQTLLGALKTRELGISNVICLLDEVKMHYQSGFLDRTKFLEVLGWYRGELEGSVLGQVARAFECLRPFYSTDVIQLGEDLFVPAFETAQGLTGELIRGSGTLGVADKAGLLAAFSILLELKYQPLIYESLREFERNGNKVSSIIRNVVYNAVVLYGTSDHRNKLESYLEINNHGQKEMDEMRMALKKRRLDSLQPRAFRVLDTGESSTKRTKFN